MRNTALKGLTATPRRGAATASFMLSTLAAGMLAMQAAAGGAFRADLRTATVLCCDTNSTNCVAAAKELEKHLALIAGARTPSPDGIVFAVGERPADAPAPAVFESCARVCGKRVCFWGEEAEHGLESSRGPLFAVYEFLDRKLGVKWVFPGDDGIVYSPKTGIELSDGECWSFTPPLPEVCSFRCYRSFRKIRRIPMPKAFRISERDFNRKCDDIEQWYGRMRLASKNRQASGHAFKGWQKRFLKDHPEWFAYVEHPALVRDGKPGRGVVDSQAHRVHGCYSCPTLPQAIVDDWVASGAPKRFNICLNDGKYCFCHCPNCLALDTRLPGEDFLDHLTDRVIHLYNGIMPLALKVRPDVDVCAYIYASYRKPPRREKVLYGDHMLFSWVPGLGDDYLAELKAWIDAGVKRFYMRPNFMCYAGVFPRGLERHLFDNFKSCMSQPGAVGVMYDGMPRPITDLEYYVICSLAQRPDRGFDELMEEFYSQYGAAAPEAKAYFEHVRARADEILAVAKGSKLPQLKQRLDDSELGKFAVSGHTFADLEAELALLRPGLEKQLAAQDRVRFSRLALRAENAVLTFRFLAAAAGKDEAAFAAAADALHAFRAANFVALGQEGASWLSNRNCEIAAWSRTKYMARNGSQLKKAEAK